MLTLIRSPFRFIPVLPQWHVKDPGHSAKSAAGRFYLNTYTLDPSKPEWDDYATVQAEWDLSGNELTRNLSGNTRSQSSQLAEPLWTDPGLKSRISLRELIPTIKKKAQVGNGLSNILPKSLHTRKKPPPPPSLTKSFQNKYWKKRRK